jgi:eukaryotic-like serine/threonine-protein kinase
MAITIDHCSGELSAGQMLGRYELLMPIAKGGMGSVWAARLKGTRGFRKLVAIKTILRTLENAQLQQMLFQEAMLASQIHHPNVAETLELGEHEGTLYLVMELVSGESLRFILREAQARGGVPFAVSINLIGQVCRGLAAAHDLRDENGQRVGLIHRDISPPNVLVTDTGTVKIIDFGVATTTSNATYGSGEIKGKISYLAPEQLRGEPLDARVDVFATGILLYLLTVNRHPFRCSSESSTIARILSPAAAAAPSAFVEDYPEAVEQIVMRALNKNRDERFASTTELLKALESAYPSAFGPGADDSVAAYVQQLLESRLQERRATLRIAEDWAETSSSRHSVGALLAVSHSGAPAPHSSRAAWVGVGGVLTGLAAAAVAVTTYLRLPLEMPAPPVATVSPAEAPPSGIVVAARRASSSLAAGMLLTDDEDGSIPQAASTAETARPNRRARAQEESAQLVPGPDPDHEEQSADGGGLEAEVEASAVASSEITSVEPPASTGTLKNGSALPPPTPLLPTNSPLPAPPGPRLLASKVGHRQLLTHPSSNAVRVPAALQRSGQAFSAGVNICVSATGQVSKVSILRSAGPALDPQISKMLSGWRYRPLLEAGKPTPFCYPLNYEIEAR